MSNELSNVINTVIHGDAIEEMRKLPDKSVDLIVIDPPYNIGKDKRWDKWDTVDAYVAFMGDIFAECERVLKDNGSFYWFHNDMAQIRRLMDVVDERTSFVYKQFIVWNKRFNGASNKGFLDGFIEVEGLRNYQKMAEYCLFYTKQDESEGNTISLRFIQDYLNEKRKAKGLSFNTLNSICGYKAIARKWMVDYTQPRLIQRKDYEKLTDVLELDKDYDELITEYDSLRYTFNNQRSHHSVWNYEVAPKLGHITPKPVELIENIIRHSSNEGDVVLDCFGGSGTTAVAAKRLGRNYVVIEREEEYVELAEQRIINESLTKTS